MAALEQMQQAESIALSADEQSLPAASTSAMSGERRCRPVRFSTLLSAAVGAALLVHATGRNRAEDVRPLLGDKPEAERHLSVTFRSKARRLRAARRSRGRPSLPSPMIAAYSGGASAEKLVSAARAGVNVIFWSFIRLANNSVTSSLNTTVIHDAHQALQRDGIHVVHMASTGGWNEGHTISVCSPGPCSGASYAESFRAWNEEMTARVGGGWPGFAGLDWDIEGVDDWSSPSNEFTAQTLGLMLDTATSLRSDFLISLVPAQSYFNCLTSGFDLSLRHPAKSKPDFRYAALNAYAALYAKSPDTFDLVMVQLYEGYSDAGFDLYWHGDVGNVGKPGWPRNGTKQAMTDIIESNVRCLSDGSWTVDFAGFWGLPNRTVISLPPDKVVMGLGNAWTLRSNFKFPYFDPAAAARGRAGSRGFMYWVISEEDAENSFTRALAAHI